MFGKYARLYLRTKFQVSNIGLGSFKQGVVLDLPTKKPLNNPPRLGLSTVVREAEKGRHINLKQKSIYIPTFFPKRLKTYLHEFVFGLLLELCYIVSFLLFS